MTIKTYRGHSVADALSQVKNDLGPDAVILHTRTLKSRGRLGSLNKVTEITATTQAVLTRRRDQLAAAVAAPREPVATAPEPSRVARARISRQDDEIPAEPMRRTRETPVRQMPRVTQEAVAEEPVAQTLRPTVIPAPAPLRVPSIPPPDPGPEADDFRDQDDGPTMAAQVPEEMVAAMMNASADMFGPPIRAGAPPPAAGQPPPGTMPDLSPPQEEEEATRALSRDELAASLDAEARDIILQQAGQRPPTAPQPFPPMPPAPPSSPDGQVVVGDDGYGDEATIAAVAPMSGVSLPDMPPMSAPTHRGPGSPLASSIGAGMAATQESPKFSDPLSFPAPTPPDGAPYGGYGGPPGPGFAAAPGQGYGEPPPAQAAPPPVPPSQPEAPFDPGFAAFLSNPGGPPGGPAQQPTFDPGFNNAPAFPPAQQSPGDAGPFGQVGHGPHDGGFPYPQPGNPQQGPPQQGYPQQGHPQQGPEPNFPMYAQQQAPQGQGGQAPWGSPAPMQQGSMQGPAGTEPSTQLLVLVALGAFFAVLVLAVGGYFVARAL